MSRFAKLFAANAIAAAGLGSPAALALSPSAAADPAVPPAVPGVPALSMIQRVRHQPGQHGRGAADRGHRPQRRIVA